MESLTEMAMIIALIFGILNIILFFKLWNMTNNVKKLTENILYDDDIWNIRKAILIGDEDEIKKRLINFVANKMIKSSMAYGENNISNIIEKYKPYFEKYNIEIPPCMNTVKKGIDIKNLFKERF